MPVRAAIRPGHRYQRLCLRLAAAHLLALLSMSIAMPQRADAQDVGNADKGRQVAEGICAECHAIKREETVSPHFNVAPFKTIANTPGMTAQALSIWLTTSHPTMPNFILEEADRRNVIAYIESLRVR